MKTNIVVPIKDFRLAKQRLGGILGPARRERLARRLCERTLAFFRTRFPDYHLLVVTASPAVAELARRQGAAVLLESHAAGLSAAATAAATWSRRHGFDSQLVIPADIARLDVDEIRQLLEHPRANPSVILCPAVDAGTNAVLTTPPDVIAFSFGVRSSDAHRRAALRAKVPCSVLRLRWLGFDIDTSADLANVLTAARGSANQDMLTLCEML